MINVIDIIDIAEAIRAARKDRKMTQAQLAEASGVSRRTIIEIENCRSGDPGFISIIRILRAVSLSIQITDANQARPTMDELIAEQNR